MCQNDMVSAGARTFGWLCKRLFLQQLSHFTVRKLVCSFTTFGGWNVTRAAPGHRI